MSELVGNVTIYTDYYDGAETETGDPFPQELMEIAESVPEPEYGRAVSERRSWPVMREFSPLRGNLISWYPFRGNEKVLEVGSGYGALTGCVADRAGIVTCVERSLAKSRVNAMRNRDRVNVTIHTGRFDSIQKGLPIDYDVVVLSDTLSHAEDYIPKTKEHQEFGSTSEIRGQGSGSASEIRNQEFGSISEIKDQEPGSISEAKNESRSRGSTEGQSDPSDSYEAFLRMLKKHLKPGGVLLCAVPNRLGLKYFAGCREDHTGIFFEGIEGYRNGSGVRTFSKPELERIFTRSGFSDFEFYYPYPDMYFPMSIYSDHYLPNPGDLRSNIENFDRDRMLLFDESRAFDALLADGLFPLFSNAFLVVARNL